MPSCKNLRREVVFRGSTVGFRDSRVNDTDSHYAITGDVPRIHCLADYTVSGKCLPRRPHRK